MLPCESLIKLMRGIPPPDSFLTAQLSECAVAVLAEYGDKVLQYGSSRAFPALRASTVQKRGRRR